MNSKQKNIALITCFVLLLIISYKYAISNTLELKKEYKNLKQQEQLFKNVPKQLSLLKQKEKYYDSLLVKYQLKGSSVQNSLLKTINASAYSDNIQLKSFLEPHIFEENNLNYKTYQFTLKGSYNDILKLIFKLEQDTKFGEIINLSFERKKNYKTGKNYLEAEVLLRSLG